MKLYQIIFSFVEPCQAVATFAANSEEEAVAQLKAQAESQVTDLEIEQITEIGTVDASGEIIPKVVQDAIDNEPPPELPGDNVIAFPGNQTRH